MNEQQARQMLDLLQDIKDLLKPKEKAPRRERITASTVTDSGFESFWLAYPKKVGRGAAEQAWAKIKPGPELIQKMIEAVKVQRRSEKWTNDGGKYIPNPATWLNEKRWMDEVQVKVQYQQPPVMLKTTPRTEQGVPPPPEVAEKLSRILGGEFMKSMGSMK